MSDRPATVVLAPPPVQRAAPRPTPVDQPAPRPTPVDQPASRPVVTPPAQARRGSRRWLRIGLGAAGVAVMVAALHGRVPSAADVAGVIGGAKGRWLLLAAVSQLVSIGMFARQQRRLLAAFGVDIELRRVLAITYARSAISISLPGGAAVSAAFAFRQFRARGASRRVAVTVMILSGALSMLALALLVVAGAALGLITPWDPGESALAAVAAAALTALVVGYLISRRRRAAHGAGTPARPGRFDDLVDRVRRRWPVLGAGLDSLTQAVSAAGSISRRDWLLATAFAALNWLADLVCLIAATHAVGLSITVLTLGGAYLAVQLIRQIPITPGGIGVIEASLLVALVSAGAAQAPAAAAILLYRLLSCWAIVAIGLVVWAGMQTFGRGGRRTPSAVSDRPAVG